MKPTIAQQDILKKYLWKNLTYNETYAEVYDHILTALENQPDNISFQEAVDSITNHDFGGFNGLAMIETRYRRAATSEIKNRYLGYLTACVKPPLIAVLIISMAAVYYVVCQSWFNYTLFIWIYFSICGILAILFDIRYIRKGNSLGRNKKSVKNRGFLWLRYIPMGILFCMFPIFPCLFFKDSDPSHWFNNASPAVITVILTAFIVHALAYYRV
jgi:hypothetical protein